MTSLSYNFTSANNKIFQANQLFSKYGLSITRVQWNDVERGFGSCYGPNISDWFTVLVWKYPRISWA